MSIGDNMDNEDYSRFLKQKISASKRKDKNGNQIQWQLTFDEWLSWWAATGHYAERGRGRGYYVMSRINDVGPYSLSNIECKLFEDNFSEGVKGYKKTAEHVAKVALANKGLKLTPAQMAKRNASRRANAALRGKIW